MSTATRYIRSTTFPQQNPVFRQWFWEKHSLVTLLLVSLLITLLPPASVSANAVSVPQHQEETGVQGEIAYVLDGNIWLHDLVSGNARQLTSDGDNLEPNWSPDGRYLVYSRGTDLESADLYVLDVEGDGEAQLLVEQACCGAWSPDGERIAYVDLSGEEPALRAVHPDGSDKETLLDPLTYGRGAYPMGKLDWVSEEYLLAPLEIIAEDSLDIYRSVILFDLSTQSGQEGDVHGCVALSADVVTVQESTDGDLLAVALAFEQTEGPCDSLQADKGIVIDWYNGDIGRALPWLAAPSFSADGTFLAAERYLESEDPSTAELWGVVVVNTLTGDELAVEEGASQPAWRPAAAVDPAALRFVQPGERLITLEVPLLFDGELYQISYLTTSDLQRRDAEFFHLASPSFFADREIRGLVVTNDGRAVTNADLLRQVFERYHAAYHLYVEPPPDLLPLLGEELDTVLGNPLLMAMSPAQFLTSARHQNAAALRAMVSVWNGEDEALSILDDVVADANQDAGTALEALGAIIEDQYQTNKALTALHADLKVAYESSQETVAWGSASLKLLRLMGELLVLSAHQQERAGWLQTYVDTFPNGVGSLNRDQLRATATVLAEAEDDYQQRLNLVVDFAKLEGTKAIVQGGTRLTQQAAADLITQLAAKYGTSLSSQAVAGLLSTVSVGLTVNSMLYGTDDLVANFQLARRSEDLRTTFRAAAADVQRQAGSRAGANAGGLSVRAYDGDLAERYRIALLLDTLATVSVYHAYADGVSASQRIPNLLTLINTLRGEDWQAAAEGLHRSADNAERAVLNDLNNPTMLDAAVTLALTRMRPQTTTDGETLVEPTTGMAFVFVPAGEFLMGSTEEQVDTALEWCNESYGGCDRAWFERELPQRTVYLDDYWIGQTEVTNAQFQHFVDAAGYETERYWSVEGWQARVENDWTGPRCLDNDNLNAPDQPVVCVSWYEADAYTHWLSETTGDSYRLPTEAEWEKAARGTDGRTFPWGDDFDGALLNFCDVNCVYDGKDDDYDDGYEYAAPVGSYPVGASPYGALDMAGNVWEWVNDWYQSDYYSVSPDSNPQGPATGDYRVLRGGPWVNGGHFVRSADRNDYRPDYWFSYFGFRSILIPANGLTASPQEKDNQEALNSQNLSEKILGVWNSYDDLIALAVYFWEDGIAYAEPSIFRYSVDETTLVIEGDNDDDARLDVLSIDEKELSFRGSDGEVVTLYRYPEIENLESKLLGYWLNSAFVNNNLADFDFANIEFLNNGQALLASQELTHYFPNGIVPYRVFNNNTVVFGTIPDSITGVLLISGISDQQLDIEYAIDRLEWKTYYDDRSLERAEGHPNLPQSILGVWEDQDNWTYEFLESGELHSLSPSGERDRLSYELLSDRTMMIQSSDSTPLYYEFVEVSEQRILVVPWGRLDSGDDLVLSRKTETSAESFESSGIVITAQEYYDMTRTGSNYQTTQYQEGLIGAQVFESGTVRTIKASGEVTVYMDVRYGQVFMHLDDINPDILMELSAGDKVSFSGTISYFGYSPVPANAAMHLNNVIVTAVE